MMQSMQETQSLYCKIDEKRSIGNFQIQLNLQQQKKSDRENPHPENQIIQ